MLTSWHAFLPFCLIGIGHVASSSLSGSPPSSVVTSATCPSRTVNYITHGLPQQCLPTPRSISYNASIPLPISSSHSNTSLASLTSVSGPSTTSILPVDAETPVTRSGSNVLSAIPTVDNTRMSMSETRESTVTQVVVDSATSPAPATPVAELDADSPLEDTRFLSFEEWKQRNLLKAGQSDHIGGGCQDDVNELRKRTVDLPHALDSLGDDAEIDLDFNGFVADRPELAVPTHPLKKSPAESVPSFDQDTTTPKVKSRSRLAGSTSKQRTNYASFDCAATVLKTNKQAKGANSVLIENKDSYMLNECSAENQFLILELCNDISIDTIVLANFEFFSSTFRTFQVSVSDKYPVKAEKWKVLGTFEARNTREIQAFLIDNPVIWARYLRIEFLTHYGSEHYCPLSLVRVHGTTMMEEYKYDMESSMVDEDDDEDSEDAEEAVVVARSQSNPAAEMESGTADSPKASSATAEPSESMSSNTTFNQSDEGRSYDKTADEAAGRAFSPARSLRNPVEFSSPISLPQRTCAVTENDIRAPGSNGTECDDPMAILAKSTLDEQPRKRSHSDPSSTHTAVSNGPPSSSTSKAASAERTAGTGSSIAPTTNGTALKGLDSTSTEKAKSNATSTQSAPANPTMQESFFKSVQKRLQMLESNSSLSLQYIEEQSRALRDAFRKVEQRQIAKTTTFLEYLNVTVLHELRDFRQQYDQLWQSTVIELELQREQYQRETFTINARLGVLADEVIFQKRMAILQMFLILICLGLVLFSRGSTPNYVDFPIVQSVLSRSPSAKRMTPSAFGTPSRSPPTTRLSSSHNMKPVNGILKGHRSGLSEASTDGAGNDGDLLSPATRTSYTVRSDLQHIAVDPPEHEAHHFGLGLVERPSTSPPMPSIPGDRLSPELGATVDDDMVDDALPESSNVDTLNQRMPEVDVNGVLPRSTRSAWEMPPG